MAITEDFYDFLAKTRHYLHENPEVSGEEFKTSEYIKNKLIDFGYTIIDLENLKTGVIAEIGPDSAHHTIGLRSDIDALPINEETGLSFTSKEHGVMHACGHDFHMASLLGAAKFIAENKEQLKAKIRLVFQPAEETHVGAQQVIEAGGAKGIDAIIGFHNKPDLKAGEISILAGSQMAAVDEFNVTFIGKGTHAASPNLGNDPIIAATTAINTLQTIVSRNEDPLLTTVLSVTHIESGSTWNVIPDKSWFEGTIRTFADESRHLAKKRFYEIVNGIAASFDLEAKISWVKGPQVVNNDKDITPIVIDETKKHANFVESRPSTAGEDFSFFTDKIPSVFAFIGSNGNSDWHHPDLVIDDAGLKTASEWYYYSALRLQEYFDNK